jgi:hypothetical protein
MPAHPVSDLKDWSIVTSSVTGILGSRPRAAARVMKM